MDDGFTLPAIIEPEEWCVVFHRKAASRAFSLIAMGRFKHVAAFAHLPAQRAWLYFDLQFSHLRNAVIPDTPEGRALLGSLIDDTEIVRMRRRGGRARWMRFGLICTTAVKHLLGLSGGALRPDALYRYCLQNGGVVLDESTGPARPAAGRPDAGAATPGCAAG